MPMWNPWRGCKKCSEGCLHCYIHKGDAKRGVDTSMIVKTKDFDKPTAQLKKGGYKMKPGFVYLGFSTDFLIEEADAWRGECWKMMKERSDCTFLFLTKRIERFAQCMPEDWGEGYENVAYMRNREEFKDILPAYVEIFENQKYHIYEIPDKLNDILRLYQIYFRDTFYCGLPEPEAADKLLTGLKTLLDMSDADEALLTELLQSAFEAEGYHALLGKTQGYYGPYIWQDTVPIVYRVELPGGAAEYTVNILKGFVFRSWMDYLTFGRYGTGGWASPDGTINCIEQAYDFESERFLVSLLKHEAQHTVDMKQFPEITPAELEYRAKLVELHYSSDLDLLQKFLAAADESK